MFAMEICMGWRGGCSDQTLPDPACSGDRGRRRWTPEVRRLLPCPCTPGSRRCKKQCGQKAVRRHRMALCQGGRGALQIHRVESTEWASPLRRYPAWSPAGCCRSSAAWSPCVSSRTAFLSEPAPAAHGKTSRRGPVPKSHRALTRTKMTSATISNTQAPRLAEQNKGNKKTNKFSKVNLTELYTACLINRQVVFSRDLFCIFTTTVPLANPNCYLKMNI